MNGTYNLGSEVATGNGVDFTGKIKELPPSVMKDIELKNHARRLASLAPIKITVRTCVACKSLFQSAGNRTCGCNTRSVGYIAGREII